MSSSIRSPFSAFAATALLLALPLAAPAQNAKPEDVGLDPDRLERITELVQRHIDAGSFSGGGQRRLVATLTEAELVFAPDGSIEIDLGADVDESQPNQIRLAPDAINVLVRQYFADPHDKRSAWRIERVPPAEPAPPLAADWLAGRLLGAALFVERNVKTWVEFVAERARGPHNRLTPLADAGDLQTPAGVRYLEGYWKLVEGEALVLEFEPAPVPYWGFLVMNFWMDGDQALDRAGELALIWSWYNICVLVVACMVCIEQPRFRRDERISVAQYLGSSIHTPSTVRRLMRAACPRSARRSSMVSRISLMPNRPITATRKLMPRIRSVDSNVMRN